MRLQKTVYSRHVFFLIILWGILNKQLRIFLAFFLRSRAKREILKNILHWIYIFQGKTWILKSIMSSFSLLLPDDLFSLITQMSKEANVLVEETSIQLWVVCLVLWMENTQKKSYTRCFLICGNCLRDNISVGDTKKYLMYKISERNSNKVSIVSKVATSNTTDNISHSNATKEMAQLMKCKTGN